jgi:hypothetical protein
MTTKNSAQFISLGDRCIPALVLRAYVNQQETLPFDWVRGNSSICYNALVTNFEKFIDFDTPPNTTFKMIKFNQLRRKEFKSSHINYYGQYFIHYTNIPKNALIDTLKRRISRFHNILENANQNNQRIIFIRCCIEQEYKCVANNIYYNFLIQIDNYIQNKYPTLNYQILNFEENIKKNSGNIINYKINILGNVVNNKLNKTQVKSVVDRIGGVVKIYRNCA